MRVSVRHWTMTLIAVAGLFLFAQSGWSGDKRSSGNGNGQAPSIEELYGAEVFAEEPVSDPLEVWNRLMYHLNDTLYYALLQPVATGYSYVMPEPGRIMVNNAFHNAAMPVRFVSAALQGKAEEATTELVRFFINSTVGFLGLFDVAEEDMELKPVDEDIGQTLGVWGVGDAVYLVWPIFGPSNLRDTFGLVGDTLLNPVSYCSEEFWVRAGVRAVEYENHLSLHLGEYEDMQKAAIDPYISLRDAYLQMRRDKVNE